MNVILVLVGFAMLALLGFGIILLARKAGLAVGNFVSGATGSATKQVKQAESESALTKA